MQFSIPGFPKYPPPPCNTPFQFNGIPQIIGEGQVTSILSHDGSVQYLFLPTAHWWRPQPSNKMQNNNYCNDVGAWFVRGIYNPMPTMYSPSYQNCASPCALPFPVPLATNSCIELPASDYKLKFHSDCCTSTSDIHYFYPNLRPHCWIQKIRSSIGIQVEVPTTSSSCQQEVNHNNKPCMCTPKKDNKKEQKAECMCCSSDSNSNCSLMSISSDINCKKRKEKRKKRQKKNIKHKNKSNDIYICECRDEQSDKCVTTCTDQTVNNRENRQIHTTDRYCRSCNTDTLLKINSEPRYKDLNTDLWIPMKPRSKKLFKITAPQKVPVKWESKTSDCTSNLCSCCKSDSDATGWTE